MKTRIWLSSIAGAAAMAATLVFAPLTMAQELPTRPVTAMQQGNGRGGTGNSNAGTCDGTCDGSNFVDADGDGVCDNASTGGGTGTGGQRRRGRG